RSELFEVTATGPRLVQVGLRDEAGTMMLSLLAGRGIGAGLVAIVGDGTGLVGSVPGSDSRLLVVETGRHGLLEVLDEQLARRRSRRVPHIDEDPAWIIREDSNDPLRRRVA